jgi:putative lipoprotein
MLALQLGITADRPSTDRWLGADKLQHYAASALIEGTVYGALRSRQVSKGRSLATATAVTIAAGVGKEMVDRRRGFAFSNKDLAWDIAGVSSAFGLLRRRTWHRYSITPQLRVGAPRAAGR